MELRAAAITIQRRFRATLEMRRECEQYNRLKQATVMVQRRFRATQIARVERARFLRQREAATRIQQWWRDSKRGERFFNVVLDYVQQVHIAATRIQVEILV